jgi:hypothetical protein
MKKTLLVVAITFGLVLSGVAGWNYFTVTQPVRKAENNRIKVWAHFQNFVNPSVLCFDLRETHGSGKIDVLSILIRSAAELKDDNFKAVILQARGYDRFILDGEYFKTLSNESNPINTARAFPSHISRMDGKKAFPEVERRHVGGYSLMASLAQMTADADAYGKELERYSDFSDQWYGSSNMS